MENQRATAEHSARKFLLLLVALSVLSGCAPLLDPEYFTLPSLPDLYLYDDFWWSTRDEETSGEEDQWVIGTTEDPTTAIAAVINSYFMAVSQRDYLLSKVGIYGPVRVEVSYQVLRGLVEPNANGDLFDYRIVFATGSSTKSELIGPSVELALWYDTNSDTFPDSDQLRVRTDVATTTPAGEASVPHTDPLIRDGVIQVDMDPETGTVHARLFSGGDTPIMEAFADVGPVPEPFYIAVQASGNGGYQARAVDKVTVVALEVE